MRRLRHGSPGAGAVYGPRSRDRKLARGGARRAADLNSEQGVLGVRQISKTRALRPLVVFGHLAALKPTHQSRYGAVCVYYHEKLAAPGEEPPDRCGKTNKVCDVATVDQLRAGDAAFDQARAEYKWRRLPRPDAPHAVAAKRGGPQQHLAVERIAWNVGPFDRVDHLGLAPAEEAFQHGDRDEDAIAVTRKALCLDDWPRVRSRRNIGVGHVFVADGSRDQHGCVGAKLGVHIPARQVAAGNRRAACSDCRANQEEGADNLAARRQKVTIFRQAGGRFVAGQLRKSLQPELAVVDWKAARQQ